MSASASTYTTKVVKEKNKHKFLVIDNEETVEFIITVKVKKCGHKVYKIFYSKAYIWSERTKGQLIIKMTDTGNEMKIELVERGNYSELNYSELEPLRLLLLFESNHANDPSHKIVEV